MLEMLLWERESREEGTELMRGSIEDDADESDREHSSDPLCYSRAIKDKLAKHYHYHQESYLSHDTREGLEQKRSDLLRSICGF